MYSIDEIELNILPVHLVYPYLKTTFQSFSLNALHCLLKIRT